MQETQEIKEKSRHVGFRNSFSAHPQIKVKVKRELHESMASYSFHFHFAGETVIGHRFPGVKSSLIPSTAFVFEDEANETSLFSQSKFPIPAEDLIVLAKAFLASCKNPDPNDQQLLERFAPDFQFGLIPSRRLRMGNTPNCIHIP